MYSTDGETWKEGATSSADIIPAPNSDLAAVWTQSDQGACDKCGGLQVLLFAYQQSNNKITVANTSETSPVLSTLDANPVPGTGLAFQQVWHSTGSPGLRLYYQDDGAEKLCTIDWETREFEGESSSPLKATIAKQPLPQAITLGAGHRTKTELSVPYHQELRLLASLGVPMLRQATLSSREL